MIDYTDHRSKRQECGGAQGSVPERSTEKRYIDKSIDHKMIIIIRCILNSIKEYNGLNFHDSHILFDLKIWELIIYNWGLLTLYFGRIATSMVPKGLKRQVSKSSVNTHLVFIIYFFVTQSVPFSKYLLQIKEKQNSDIINLVLIFILFLLNLQNFLIILTVYSEQLNKNIDISTTTLLMLSKLRLVV